MRFFFTLIFFVFLPELSKTTSLSFDQNSVFDQNPRLFEFNNRNSINNTQTLILGSSIGYFSKKLYETGFFSPLGLIPKQIKSLSPLAYKNVYKNDKNTQIINECNTNYKTSAENKLNFRKRNKNLISMYCLKKENHLTGKSNALIIRKYYK